MSGDYLTGAQRYKYDGKLDVIAHNWGPYKALASAFIGTTLTAAVTHPLETLKIHAQVGNRLETRQPLVYTACYIRTYGIRTLYRGFKPSLTSALLSTTTVAALTWKAPFTEVPATYGQAYTAALLGSFIGAWSYIPFEVAVTRMQADSAMPLAYRRYYTGPLNAVRRMRKEEGRTAYLTGTILGWWRWAFYYSTLYATYPFIASMLGGTGPVPTYGTLAALNLVLSFLTMPLDTSKVYIQTQPLVQPLMPYPKLSAWLYMTLFRWMAELALRMVRGEWKARTFLLLERFKNPPKPYYYPRTIFRILKFVRKRGLYYAYNGFTFYYMRNCAATMGLYTWLEYGAKKWR